MSISVDQARYFIPSYAAQNLAPADDAPSAANQSSNASEDDQTTVAPPPTSSNQLLASGDMRLLLLRGLNGDGVEGYKSILDQFYSDPANREDPVSFLKNLSDDGIDLLKQAQSLPAGAQIDLSKLNQEEALNFILPHSGQVDLNNDGIVASANGGKGFMFPPPNAPQDVKDAWKEATDGMSDSDIFLMSGKFMMQFMISNIRVDDNGNVHRAEPGDPDWRNIFAEDGYSYMEAINEFKAANEFSRPDNTPEMYERIKSLLARLENVFSSHGIA
ncbi:MAG: hypothetical protein KAH11_06815 [Rhodospirillales bacterium]|nr:hypothetical protein [Rhodospirillales bacterium]